MKKYLKTIDALSEGNGIVRHDLPRKLTDPSVGESYAEELPPEGVDLEAKIRDFERTLIGQAMKKAINSQTKAARLLKLTPRSLRYKLDKYNMKDTEN